MVIDFIKVNVDIPSWDAWRTATSYIILKQSVYEGSGEIVRKYGSGASSSQNTVWIGGKFDSYRLTIAKSEKTLNYGKHETVQNNYLSVFGSMHKNHHNYENHSPFTWSEIQSEISNISSVFSIDERAATLTKLEVGVNVELAFPVYDFLRNSLLGYKGKEFSRYKPDRKGKCIGYECGLTHYTVKAYDKGLQCNLKKNLFRFELSFKNMQAIRKKGIMMLSDLRQSENMQKLLELLLKAWDDVDLSEPALSLKISGLTETDKELIHNGANPKYWESLKDTGRKKYERKRRDYRELIKKYGENQHLQIRQLLEEELTRLMSL